MILVIIPVSKGSFKYGFSQPLQWLFTRYYRDLNIVGVFGDDPNLKYYIQQSHTVIIELNWFYELYEFIMYLNFIKSINKKISVIGGGLFIGYHYEYLIKNTDLDYVVRGDNEYSLPLLLESLTYCKSINFIPNLVSKSFNNPIEVNYDSLYDLKFSIEWFPTYKKRVLEKTLINDELYSASPVFFTYKSGCAVKNRKGCEWCAGLYSQKPFYNRETLKYSAQNINQYIHEYENIFDFNRITIFDMTDDFDYESLNYHDFNLFLEVHGNLSLEKLQTISSKFKSIELITGSGTGIIDKNYSKDREQEIQDMINYIDSTKNIKLKFFYHHHQHNESFKETALEKKYPHYFRHSEAWISLIDGKKTFLVKNLYDFSSNKENFRKIYDISKNTYELLGVRNEN